jgi:hypothetical protein
VTVKTFRLGTLTLLLLLNVTALHADDGLLRGPSTTPRIQIITLDELSFGRMTVLPHGGGTIAIDPVGPVIVYGGVIPLGRATGPAVFELRGEPNARFIIELPSQVDMRSDTGRGMAVLRDFRCRPEGVGTFDATGRARVWVGATLDFGPYSSCGRFATQFDIRVEYAAATTTEIQQKPRGKRDPWSPRQQ